MSNFSITRIFEPITCCVSHRELILTLIRRDISSRYSGSFMGILWVVLTPLLMITIYTFVFSIVFEAKWGQGVGSKTSFALVLFSGLMLFNFFSECISRAPSLIIENSNYVKKIVFPLEVLPIVLLGTGFFHFVISFFVWLVAELLILGRLPPTALFFPLVILPLCILIVGLSWIIASLGVFLRDINHFISIALTIIMFLSPIFYPITALPKEYRPLLWLSPLMPVIEQTRAVLIAGVMPDIAMLTIYYAAAIVVMEIGFLWFKKTKNGFADVL